MSATMTDDAPAAPADSEGPEAPPRKSVRLIPALVAMLVVGPGSPR